MNVLRNMLVRIRMREYRNEIDKSNLHDDIKAFLNGIIACIPLPPWTVFTEPLESPEICWYVEPFLFDGRRDGHNTAISIRLWKDYMTVERERLHMDHPLYEDIDLHTLSYSDPKYNLEYISNLILNEIKNEDKFLRDLVTK